MRQDRINGPDAPKFGATAGCMELPWIGERFLRFLMVFGHFPPAIPCPMPSNAPAACRAGQEGDDGGVLPIGHLRGSRGCLGEQGA